MGRYLFDGQYFLLEINQSTFDNLSTDQKHDLKKFIQEVGLRGHIGENIDEVANGTTNLPHRMTQVRLPVVGPKRFAIIEAVLGDSISPTRELTLTQAKQKFVTKLANRLNLSTTKVNDSMTFTAFGADWESSRLGTIAYIKENITIWEEEIN